MSALSKRLSGDTSVPVDRGAILKVENVSRAFGGVRAVRDATFAVSSGTVTGLIGPNGAGKSTMCNLIAGLTRPDSGRIEYDGRDVTGAASHRLAARGLLRTFQSSSEFRTLTVTQNLLVGIRAARGGSLAGALRGKRHWAADEQANLCRVREVLAEFHLLNLADQVAGQLSGGQKRLLELMRAIVAQPRMLLLDEPLAGVHPTMIGSVIEAVRRLRARGVTVLMVEHNLGVVEQLCDDVIVMAGGTVIASGRMKELRKDQQVVDAYFRG